MLTTSPYRRGDAFYFKEKMLLEVTVLTNDHHKAMIN